MQTRTVDVPALALQADEGEARWFLGTLVTIKATGAATAGRFALIEHLAPQGSGSPLHVHEREDEWFYILDGRLDFWVGGRRIEAAPGSFVYGPRGIPHTFAVASPTARFLLGVEPAGFEDFVRALSVPARSLSLPPPTEAPPDLAKLAGIAASFGIEILGPPGLPA